MSVPAGKVMLADLIVKLPDWLSVLSRKWATLPPARSVNVATPVLPSEKVMLTGPKSFPSIVAPSGYAS
jgi:hypothetical protein